MSRADCYQTDDKKRKNSNWKIFKLSLMIIGIFHLRLIKKYIIKLKNVMSVERRGMLVYGYK